MPLVTLNLFVEFIFTKPFSLGVRLFANLLYGVSPTDLATFSGTSLVLFLAAMAASYFPARRAMQVQPTISLRTE